MVQVQSYMDNTKVVLLLLRNRQPWIQSRVFIVKFVHLELFFFTLHIFSFILSE